MQVIEHFLYLSCLVEVAVFFCYLFGFDIMIDTSLLTSLHIKSKKNKTTEEAISDDFVFLYVVQVQK